MSLNRYQSYHVDNESTLKLNIIRLLIKQGAIDSAYDMILQQDFDRLSFDLLQSWLLEKGICQKQKHNYRTAIESFRKIHEPTPDVLRHLIDCCVELGQSNEAYRYYLYLAPKDRDQELMVKLARFAESTRNLEAMQQYYKFIGNNFPHILHQLMDGYIESSQYEKAFNCYSHLRVEHRDYHLMLKFARLAESAGDYTTAQQSYEFMRNVFPPSSELSFYYARFSFLSQSPYAEEILNCARTMYPNHSGLDAIWRMNYPEAAELKDRNEIVQTKPVIHHRFFEDYRLRKQALSTQALDLAKANPEKVKTIRNN